MARLARVVAVDTAHHITQRGNDRRTIFESDRDRFVYLSLLQEHARLQRLSVLGYCLMPNHVHLVAVPMRPDSMSKALRDTHGRYATYLNNQHSSSGHVWQGRYYSCPMDESHLWNALRYTELNPVRAGIVVDASAYPWSTAALHCEGAIGDGFIHMEEWHHRWNSVQWRKFLSAADAATHDDLIRKCTHNGRPLGSADFVQALESHLKRALVPDKGGRPRRELVNFRHLFLKEELPVAKPGERSVCPGVLVAPKS
jgi:putative transposase